MRNYDFNYVGLRHRQTGGVGQKIGDVTIATTPPVVGGQTWEDVHVRPAAPYKIATYPDLFAVQGMIFQATTNNPNNAAAAASLQDTSTVWKGAIYGRHSSGFRKKASPFATYGAAVFTGVAGGTVYSLIPFDNAVPRTNSSRLFLGSISGDGLGGYIKTITSDSVFTEVGVGGNGAAGHLIWVAFDTGVADTYILLSYLAGPIIRTTNGGTSWTLITSNLSSGSARVWTAIWRSGATLWMLGQSGAVTSSADNGVTWTVPNTSLANAPTTDIEGVYNKHPTVFLDYTARVGYCFTQSGGAVHTFNMDNPLAGFTILHANGTWASSSVLHWPGSRGVLVMSNYNVVKPGIWLLPFDNPTVPRQILTSAQIPANGQPNTSTSFVGFLGEFDGAYLFDNTSPAATFPANFITPNGIETFDRWFITDPGFTGGRKGYMRVL